MTLSEHLRTSPWTRVTAGVAAASLVVAGLVAACGAQGPGVDLQITGAIDAHVVGAQGMCSSAPAAGPAGIMASFAVAPEGEYYNLRFLTDRVGAGDYNVSTSGTFVAFNGQGPGWTTLAAHSRALVVDSGGSSGSLSVTFSPTTESTGSALRIPCRCRSPAAPTGDPRPRRPSP